MANGKHLYNFDHSVEMEVHSCPSCGMPYAAPVNFFKHINNGRGENSWCCPRGHSIQFAQTEADRLKKQLADKERSRQFFEGLASRREKERDHARHQARGQKAAKTRIKNRITNGVCPCCNRTFQNLASHMKAKHPNYADAE